MRTDKSGVSRRTITKGVAWSVPVLGLVTLAPAYATSPDNEPPVAFTLKPGDSCKWPGNQNKNHYKGYRLHGVLENKSNSPATVTIDSFGAGYRGDEPITWTYAGFRLPNGKILREVRVGAKERLDVWLVIDGEADSANTSISGVVTATQSFGELKKTSTFEFNAPAVGQCKKQGLDF